MPKRCAICVSEHREEIDALLVQGQASYRDIGGRFGFSKSTVERHKAHIGVHLLQAKEAQEVLSAAKLLTDLQGLQKRAITLLDRAEASFDIRAAIACLREAREVVSAMARILEQSELEKRLTELEQRLELGNTIT